MGFCPGQPAIRLPVPDRPPPRPNTPAARIASWRRHLRWPSASGRLRTGRAGTGLLTLLALLQGCVGSDFGPRQTLHVLMVPTERIDWMRRDFRDNEALRTLLAAFQRLRPDVSVEISIEPQETLVETLRRRNSRGLGPDLILVRAPQAVSLAERGLVEPLPSGDPRMRELLPLITPKTLRRVRTPRGLAGLPVFTEFSLACYDRRRLNQPPATLNALLALAASGHNVGLSADPTGIWWTAGALGAQTTMMQIITGFRDPLAPPESRQRSILGGWMRWLRQAALQSHVEMASGSRDLTTGLETGRLSWIPCFSLTLIRLNRTMGANLGVASLPSGPGGPASPFSTTRVWALGRDSSPQQRQLALELAALSLDPLVQRDMMIQNRVLLPANRYVPIPLASSGQLAALSRADQAVDEELGLMAQPFSIDRLQRLLPTLQTVMVDVMVGVMTPEQGADALLRLRPQGRGSR